MLENEVCKIDNGKVPLLLSHLSFLDSIFISKYYCCSDNGFFPDNNLLNNFQVLKTCPRDFDEILHVPSNGNCAPVCTKIMPEVTPGASLT